MNQSIDTLTAMATRVPTNWPEALVTAAFILAGAWVIVTFLKKLL